MSRYQKGKTNLDFTEARDSEWQWHQLGHMQVCTLLQTDNHASTPPLCFLQAGCPSCRPTNSVKALKAIHNTFFYIKKTKKHKQRQKQQHSSKNNMWMYVTTILSKQNVAQQCKQKELYRGNVREKMIREDFDCPQRMDRFLANG